MGTDLCLIHIGAHVGNVQVREMAFEFMQMRSEKNLWRAVLDEISRNGCGNCQAIDHGSASTHFV